MRLRLRREVEDQKTKGLRDLEMCLFLCAVMPLSLLISLKISSIVILFVYLLYITIIID